MGASDVSGTCLLLWLRGMRRTAEKPAIAARPAEWIAAIAKRGDRPSFVCLFNHFAPRVKSYLLRLGVAESLAEELTQDTFLTIWRKAAQFDPSRASAPAWIYTIARNRWFDVLRRDRHPEEHSATDLPAVQPTPEDELRALEGENRLRCAFQSLPSEQAEVLRLSYFEERTHAEIAERLGVPLGTVKSRIRLAAKRLRISLEESA